MDGNNRADDVMVRDATVPPRQDQSLSLGVALRVLLDHLTRAQDACETQLTQFQQHCKDTEVDISNRVIRQREWTLWAREWFDTDMYLHLQGLIDRGRRQVAASYSWQYSSSQDVSGHLANAIRLLDVSCQMLIAMIHQGVNDWDALTGLELELRAAIGYANLSKVFNPEYFRRREGN
ncbi:hypothetical protein Neosp_011388 [[Neocosmospora] mangrovei]